MIAAKRDGNGTGSQGGTNPGLDIGMGGFGIGMHDVRIPHIHDPGARPEIGDVIFMVIGPGMAKGEKRRGLTDAAWAEPRTRAPLGTEIERSAQNGDVGVNLRPIGLILDICQRWRCPQRAGSGGRIRNHGTWVRNCGEKVAPSSGCFAWVWCGRLRRAYLTGTKMSREARAGLAKRARTTKNRRRSRVARTPMGADAFGAGFGVASSGPARIDAGLDHPLWL